jgi:hypothetical protein
MKLAAPAYRQAGTERWLPGNVNVITRSAVLPAHMAGHPADLPATSASIR